MIPTKEQERRDRRAKYQRAWRAANPEKSTASTRKWNAANPEYKRKWNAANVEKRTESQRAWRAANPGMAGEYTARWKEANPEKVAAHYEVLCATRAGILERQPCEVCGTTDRIHAHHEDYSKPLDVVWLCREHHKEAHHQ